MKHLGSDACIGFIFSVMLSLRANAFSLETVTHVTKDVIMKHNSICVYVMHSDRQQGGSVFYLMLFLIFKSQVCSSVIILSLSVSRSLLVSRSE